jgi:hypothetical protein
MVSVFETLLKVKMLGSIDEPSIIVSEFMNRPHLACRFVVNGSIVTVKAVFLL